MDENGGRSSDEKLDLPVLEIRIANRTRVTEMSEINGMWAAHSQTPSIRKYLMSVVQQNLITFYKKTKQTVIIKIWFILSVLHCY